MILTLLTAAHAVDPEQDAQCNVEGVHSYAEQYLGVVDDHPMLLVTCRTNMFSHGHFSETLTLEWRGPEPVRTQLESIGNAWLEGVRLEDGRVVFDVVPTGNPYGGPSFSTTHVVELGDDHRGTETYRPTALTAERQEEMALGLFFESWLTLGVQDPDSAEESQLPLFEERLHRFALDRFREGNKLHTAALVAPFVSMAIPQRLQSDTPRLNDMGYFLVEAGAYKAGIPVLRTVTKRDPRRAVAKLNLADAFWAVGDDRAPSLYEQYARLVEHPVKRARKRSDRKAPAARTHPPPATASLVDEALQRDDLWLVWGYALLSQTRLPADHPFWKRLHTLPLPLDETTREGLLAIADDPKVLEKAGEGPPLGLRAGALCRSGTPGCSTYTHAYPKRILPLTCGRGEWPCDPPEGRCLADLGFVRCGGDGPKVAWDGRPGIYQRAGERLCVKEKRGQQLRCSGPELPEVIDQVDWFLLVEEGLCATVDGALRCWGVDPPEAP